jgi:hypothetical protein
MPSRRSFAGRQGFRHRCTRIVPDLWEKMPKARLKEELERVRQVPPDPAPDR